MRIALLLDLAAFSLIVSQPLFYLIALTGAQRALSAPAYIELRQRINAAMNRRIPAIYAGAFLLDALVLIVSVRSGATLVAVAAAAALLCLVADAFLMIRENVPINGVVDSWSISDVPPDWESYRARWFDIFRYRQVLLLLGFALLMIGAVYGA